MRHSCCRVRARSTRRNHLIRSVAVVGQQPVLASGEVTDGDIARRIPVRERQETAVGRNLARHIRPAQTLLTASVELPDAPAAPASAAKRERASAATPAWSA